MRYSLANYIVSITPNDNAMKIFGTISIGGEGSYLDSINLSLANNLYDTTSYSTGAWVHDKNLAKNGTVSITLNQLSAQVAKFKQMANMLYSSDYDGLTITVSDTLGNEVAKAIDCYFIKIPDQDFGQKASNQQWQLTAGKISFN